MEWLQARITHVLVYATMFDFKQCFWNWYYENIISSINSYSIASSFIVFPFSCCWGGKIAKNENCATLLDKCALSRKGASDARQFSPTLSLGLGGTFLNEEKMDENVYNNSWWCWLSYSSPASSIYTLILIDSQIMILYSSKSFKSNKNFFRILYYVKSTHFVNLMGFLLFFST